MERLKVKQSLGMFHYIALFKLAIIMPLLNVGIHRVSSLRGRVADTISYICEPIWVMREGRIETKQHIFSE